MFHFPFHSPSAVVHQWSPTVQPQQVYYPAPQSQQVYSASHLQQVYHPTPRSQQVQIIQQSHSIPHHNGLYVNVAQPQVQNAGIFHYPQVQNAGIVYQPNIIQVQPNTLDRQYIPTPADIQHKIEPDPNGIKWTNSMNKITDRYDTDHDHLGRPLLPHLPLQPTIDRTTAKQNERDKLMYKEKFIQKIYNEKDWKFNQHETFLPAHPNDLHLKNETISLPSQAITKQSPNQNLFNVAQVFIQKQQEIDRGIGERHLQEIMKNRKSPKPTLEPFNPNQTDHSIESYFENKEFNITPLKPLPPPPSHPALKTILSLNQQK